MKNSSNNPRSHDTRLLQIQKGRIIEQTALSASSSCEQEGQDTVASEAMPKGVIDSKETAVNVIANIIAGNPSRFELVSSEIMRKYHKLRSEYYMGFHFLCHINSKKHAGWLLCNYVLSNHCALKNGIKKFDTDTGTSTLRNHLKTHNVSSGKLTDPKFTKIGNGMKSESVEASVFAVARVLLPFNFLNTPGMVRFAEALIKAGRSVPVNAAVDVTACSQSLEWYHISR